MNITVNLAKMFNNVDPWDCANSQANLGPDAARYTWAAAQRVAMHWRLWLRPATKAGLHDACETMATWARDTGAWGKDEISQWSDVDLLAILVQNIAADIRECKQADDAESMIEVVRMLNASGLEGGRTDFYIRGSQPFATFYAGI